jgi:hypothetical protein
MISNSTHDLRLNSGSKSFARRGRRSLSRKSWFRSMFIKIILSMAILLPAVVELISVAGGAGTRKGAVTCLQETARLTGNTSAIQLGKVCRPSTNKSLEHTYETQSSKT